MTQDRDRVTECPFPMKKSLRERIEEESRERGVPEAVIFNEVVERGFSSV